MFVPNGPAKTPAGSARSATLSKNPMILSSPLHVWRSMSLGFSVKLQNAPARLKRGTEKTVFFSGGGGVFFVVLKM